MMVTLKMFTGNLDVEWFNHVKNGKKTVEGRLKVDKWARMEVGNKITFKCVGNDDTVTVVITEIRTFGSFREMFNSYGVNIIMPGDTIDSACVKYKKIYGERQESEIVGIKFKIDEST